MRVSGKLLSSRRWLRPAVRRLGRLAAYGLAVAAGLFVVFLLLDRLFPFPEAALHRPVSVVVEDRAGEPLRMFLGADQRWRLPVTLDQVPPEMVAALIASEDRRFYLHPGVDPLAVLRAAIANLRAGAVVSGASTLPMQIARMAVPRRRTLGAKTLEAFRALQLTLHHTKSEQLELYLNLAPYGGNLEGVGAASWFYFGKRPRQLSLGEVALLTALPRAPSVYDPTRGAAARRAAAAARASVLARLERLGLATAEQVAEARRQPLPERLRPVPFAAPHLARRVARSAAPAAGETGGWRLATHLDRGVQRAAEAAVTRRIGELRAAGVGNAAAVVLELPGRELRALVGSAGFFDEAHQGQVDGALARRSPGSALKPFLYALAIDDGRLVPSSWVLDVPTDFAGYVPENYDGRYRGRVSAGGALALSLNAPAVRLLAATGVERFVAFLHRGGLDSLDRPVAEYGLPLILGGGEVTLLELTNLYADLAAGGLHRPPAVLAGGSSPPGERLVSPEAARLVTEVLAGVSRPDLPVGWALTRDAAPVAWKTGTSYGHRDAWAVGYTGRWVVGVWVGNFDGAAVQGISGAQHAGPLLFDLLRALPPGEGLGRRSPALAVEPREVCALSHLRPGPYCPERLRVDAVAGHTRLAECDWHRRVFVDRDTGERLAGDCLGRRPHTPRVLEVYPAELAAWWAAEGRPPPPPPPLSADCGGAAAGEPPAIVSPDPATPYRLRRDTPLDFQRIPLVARTGSHLDPAAARLFWFQNGRLVASGAVTEPLFLDPRRGVHRLVVVDESGRSDRVTYRVE